jgi:tRNA nucleotidyltransferase (CCA-adding enzyme)
VMRAIRFTATLEFEMEPATEAAIPSALGSLARVSWERVHDELVKLLASRQPSRGLAIARRTGVLALVLPETAASLSDSRTEAATWARVDAAPREAPVIRLAALLLPPPPDAPPDAEQAARRLKLSNEEREQVVSLVRHARAWQRGPLSDPDVRRLLGKVGRKRCADALTLWQVELADGVLADEADKAAVRDLVERVARILEERHAIATGELAISGGDLMRVLAIPPGRDVGRVLEALLARVIEDPALNDRATLEALAPAVLAELRSTAT